MILMILQHTKKRKLFVVLLINMSPTENSHGIIKIENVQYLNTKINKNVRTILIIFD